MVSWNESGCVRLQHHGIDRIEPCAARVLALDFAAAIGCAKDVVHDKRPDAGNIENGGKNRISAFDCRAQRYRRGYALRDTDFHRRSVHFSSAKREAHAGPERSGDRSGEEECEGRRVCHVQPARTQTTAHGKKGAALRKTPGAFSDETWSKASEGTG